MKEEVRRKNIESRIILRFFATLRITSTGNLRLTIFDWRWFDRLTTGLRFAFCKNGGKIKENRTKEIRMKK